MLLSRVRFVAIALAATTAGCLDAGTHIADAPRSPAMAAAFVPAPILTTTGCSEMDYTVATPVSDIKIPAPFHPIPADPAGLTVNVVVNAPACGAVALDGAARRPVAFYLMVPVRPVAGLTIANASSYVFLLQVVSEDPVLQALYRERGVEAYYGLVGVHFSDVENLPKSQGLLGVCSPFLPRCFTVETHMAGTPGTGSAGRLGLYTGNASVASRVHAVDFSDYRFYPGGAGVWRATLGSPLPLDESRPVQASHNLGYDATFRFDLGTLAAK